MDNDWLRHIPYPILVTIKHVIRTKCDTYYLANCHTMEVQTVDAEQVNQFIVCLKKGKTPG